MSEKRQKNQIKLAFLPERTSETRKAPEEGIETFTAKRGTESPTSSTEKLMEEACEWENYTQALKRVTANKGKPGIDGMTVEELPGYLKEHWLTIREQLLTGSYRPQPVRRVEIPKPDGGMRKLGIPTVKDRLVQQAMLQVMQRSFDASFSEHSYGFRPGRSAKQAVARTQEIIASGRSYVVDLDLEKFFDRVNHDRLMAHLA